MTTYVYIELKNPSTHIWLAVDDHDDPRHLARREVGRLRELHEESEAPTAFDHELTFYDASELLDKPLGDLSTMPTQLFFRLQREAAAI